MNIEFISKDDVRTIFKEEFSKYDPVIFPDQEQFINKEQCAALLGGVCLSTVDNLRRRGILKPYKIGSAVRFKRNEVIDAIDLLNKKS